MGLTSTLPNDVRREGLRVEEAAHIIGCGRTTVFQLIRQGRLRVVKLGTRTVIPRSEITRLLAETKNGTTGDIA